MLPTKTTTIAALGVAAAILLTGSAASATPTTTPGQDCRPGVVAELYADGTWAWCQTDPPTTPTPPTTSPPATPLPTMDPTVAPTTGPAPAPPTPTASAPAPTTIRAYITGYSRFSNTPAGSAQISNPVLHTSAGGTGTYADPVTVAVGHTVTGHSDVLDWPAGTTFWVPDLRRYLIVEDSCGDGDRPQNGPCHTGYPAGASTWLDVWINGQGGTQHAAERCADAITRVSTVVVNPGPEYDDLVVAGDIYQPSGCTSQYGDTL